MGCRRVAADAVPAKRLEAEGICQAPNPGGRRAHHDVREHLHPGVSLAGMLQPDAFHAYVKRATGEKFLVTPNQPSHNRVAQLPDEMGRWSGQPSDTGKCFSPCSPMLWL